MATKLKSLLLGRRLPLVLNAFLFSLGLFGVYATNSDWLAVAIFLLLALYLYTHPKGQAMTTTVISSLTTVIGLVLMVFASSFFAAGSLAVFGGVLWYLIIGIKNVEFLERKQWHLFLVDAVLYAGLAIFFLASPTTLSVVKLLALAVIGYLVNLELFRNHFSESAKKTDLALVSGILSLITTKIAWVVGFLPLGFISSINATMVMLFARKVWLSEIWSIV